MVALLDKMIVFWLVHIFPLFKMALHKTTWTSVSSGAALCQLWLKLIFGFVKLPFPFLDLIQAAVPQLSQLKGKLCKMMFAETLALQSHNGSL